MIEILEHSECLCAMVTKKGDGKPDDEKKRTYLKDQ